MVKYKGMDLPEKTISAIRKYRSLQFKPNYVCYAPGDPLKDAFWPTDSIDFLHEQTHHLGVDRYVLDRTNVRVVCAFYHGNVSREELETEEKILLD